MEENTSITEENTSAVSFSYDKSMSCNSFPAKSQIVSVIFFLTITAATTPTCALIRNIYGRRPRTTYSASVFSSIPAAIISSVIFAVPPTLKLIFRAISLQHSEPFAHSSFKISFLFDFLRSIRFPPETFFRFTMLYHRFIDCFFIVS